MILKAVEGLGRIGPTRKLQASVAKSGSCNEPDFKCDRLGSEDETAGWEADLMIRAISDDLVRCTLSWAFQGLP